MVRFSFWQAFSVRSAVCGPGGFLARARALSTPFSRTSGAAASVRHDALLILPVLVAVFGILSVYGVRGWLASFSWQMLETGGHSPLRLAGHFTGARLLTCQWRRPFVARLQSLESIPGEQRQLTPPAAVCAAGIFSALSNGPWLRRQNSARRGADFYALLRQFT